MPPDTAALADLKPTASSRITNGSALLPGVDGRTHWARRMRDLMRLHVADLGGDDAISEAERSLVRRAATLTVELERMERDFALAEGADPDVLYQYQTCANSLRRLLESVGLRRRPRDVTPDLRDYIEGSAA